jgi:hypothetical protein
MWSAPVFVDHQPPFDGNGMNSISCPTVNLCVAVEYSHVITSSNPTGGAAAWTVTSVDGFSAGNTPFMSVVTCPSEVLCVAVDTNSDSVVTSINPTGGAAAWKVTKLPAATNLKDLSCPSPSMCVGIGGDATVVTSRNPTGGATAWTAVKVAGLPVCGPRGEGSLSCGLTGVSCPTETFCAAVDTVGNLITSRNPSGGAASWNVSRLGKLLTGLEYPGQLSDVICGGPELCVLLGANDIVTSSTPTAGVAGWKLTHLTRPDHYLTAVSCASSTFCVAVDQFGDVITSSNPAGGAAAWITTNVEGVPVDDPNAQGVPLSDVSCPTSSLCVAIDSGNVVTSSNPTGGAAAWAMANVDSSNDVQGMSCPTINLCVAVDHFSNVVTSTNPTGEATTWTVTNLSGSGVSSLSSIYCPSSQLCIAVGDQIVGDWDYPILVTSTNPTAGPPAWKVTRVADPGVAGVSCPSIRLCVVVGGNDVSTSTNPNGGSASWAVAHLTTGSNFLTDVSCPTLSLCVALDTIGNVFTSSKPGGGVRAWKKVARVSASDFQAMLSCPSTDLCVAADMSGDVASGDPTGGAAVWKVTKPSDNRWLSAMSCPSVNLCVAVGYGGNVLTTITPADGAAAWKSIHAIGTNFLIDVSCPTVSLCFAADSAGTVVIGTSQP